ncbi:MAG: tRNA preQ1(34) S-adenosylmethionine ribosyltransferase-isomerase QueA [Planctomycetota bacterium]
MAHGAYFLEYDLPKELIAQQPLSNRADARLLVVDRQRQSLAHHHVRDLPDLLRAGDRLVLNNTRVMPAQLVGKRVGTGGRWQGLYLGTEPDGHWRLVCKTRGRLSAGDSVDLEDRDGRVADKLWLLERLDGGQWLAHLNSDRSAEDALPQIGRVPLPPYIRGGQMVDADTQAYQTVFARKPGAVAAPTAGLHFTKPLLQSIEHAGVGFAAVTLHVGLGTFRPISPGGVEQHQMHAEWCELDEAAAQSLGAARDAGGRIVAVGTTCVRTLETAAAGGRLQAWRGQTDLFIKPPYAFAAVDAMMTNFHFPGTTLLLLVQAFAGRDLLEEAYREAIREEYRFYSYGDAMLIV